MKKLLDWLQGKPTDPPITATRTDYTISQELRNHLDQWKASGALHRTLSELRNAFISFKAQSNLHPHIDFMSGSHNHGFILDVQHQSWNTMDAQALLLYWKELLQEESYINSMSDIRHQGTQKQKETTYRHYMKPSKRQLSPGNQKYGNIELVFHQMDEQPFYLKCQVNAYQDALYDEPEDFGQLVFYMTGYQ